AVQDRSGTEVTGVLVALHQAGSQALIHVLAGPAADAGIVGILVVGDLHQIKGAGQHSGNFLTGDSLVRLEGAVLVTVNNAVLGTEVDGVGGPVTVHIGEGRGRGGLILVVHSPGDHSSELGAGQAALGLVFAVAHTFHIAL